MKHWEWIVIWIVVALLTTGVSLIIYHLGLNTIDQRIVTAIAQILATIGIGISLGCITVEAFKSKGHEFGN